MSHAPRRLVGLELHSERPGDSASFYAWLLGPGSGGEVEDWNPITLLFEHGVCEVLRTETGGPRGWVPVIALDDVEESARRTVQDGGRVEVRERRRYLVDDDDIWTRVVPHDDLPADLDLDAVGATNADYLAVDPGRAADRWASRLLMERVEIVDDIDGLNFVVSDRRPAFGTVSFSEPLQTQIAWPSWLVYFEVPSIPLSVSRAREVGTLVAVPPSHEDYNDWCVLVDPFGTPFGLSVYYDAALSGLRVRTPRGEEAFGDAIDLPPS